MIVYSQLYAGAIEQVVARVVFLKVVSRGRHLRTKIEVSEGRKP